MKMTITITITILIMIVPVDDDAYNDDGVDEDDDAVGDVDWQ